MLIGIVVGLAPSGLAVDGRLVARVASFATVDGCVLSGERRFHPAQGRSRSGELIALAGRPRGRLVEAALALVLLPLSLVLRQLAFLGIAVPPVRIVVAEVRATLPLVGGCIAKIRRRPGGTRTVGGAALGLGMLVLDLGRIHVPLQCPAVELGGPPMEIDQRGIGGLGHQALAALRGLALAAGVLAVHLRPPRQVAMVGGGHDRKVLRTATLRERLV